MSSFSSNMQPFPFDPQNCIITKWIGFTNCAGGEIQLLGWSYRGLYHFLLSFWIYPPMSSVKFSGGSRTHLFLNSPTNSCRPISAMTARKKRNRTRTSLKSFNERSKVFTIARRPVVIKFIILKWLNYMNQPLVKRYGIMATIHNAAFTYRLKCHNNECWENCQLRSGDTVRS